MKDHNKITLAREYCLCRRIPYKITGEQLRVGTKEDGFDIIYSLYHIPYSGLIPLIDSMVIYDSLTTYYIGIARRS